MPVQVTNVCAKVDGDGVTEPEVADAIDAVTTVKPVVIVPLPPVGCMAENTCVKARCGASAIKTNKKIRNNLLMSAVKQYVSRHAAGGGNTVKCLPGGDIKELPIEITSRRLSEDRPALVGTRGGRASGVIKAAIDVLGRTPVEDGYTRVSFRRVAHRGIAG